MTVITAPDDASALALIVGGRTVGRLAPADPDAPSRPDGRVEWQLHTVGARFPTGVLAMPFAAPVEAALGELDSALADASHHARG